MPVGAFHNADATVSARKGVVVTPADATDLTNGVCRAIYIGVTGDLVVVMPYEDDTVTFTNVPVGIFPIQCRQIYSTGTTASGIVALY
jgi:hypothetical protein